MKGKIYPYNIHPVELDIDPTTEYSYMKKAIEPEGSQKDWEEKCLCNTCRNSCVDNNIVYACSSYEEMKGVKC